MDELNVSLQAPAHLVAQAVDLLLQEQKGRILLFAGADFPPLPGIVQEKKDEQGEKDTEQDDEPNFHRPKSKRKSPAVQPFSFTASQKHGLSYNLSYLLPFRGFL